jgi:hypothetical protein
MRPSNAWKQLSSDPLIAVCDYSFGAGTANALVEGVDGGVIVVSPPCRVADRVLDAAAAFGSVRALVASNAFHYMGLKAWKARFPDAQVFAPAQSIARVAAKTGLTGIRPVAAVAAICGDRVTLTDMPHYKTGEVLVRIRAADGLAWYVTDVMLNLPQLPAHPIARFAFRVSGSAPGLRMNRISPLFMVKDRVALWHWLRGEADRDPPRWLIPAHGQIVDLSATPARLCELLGLS